MNNLLGIIDIKVQGIELCAVIDSREECSLISTALQEQFDYKTTSQEFYFSIKNVKFNYSMKLVKEDKILFILLGKDWIKHARIQISKSGNQLKIFNGQRYLRVPFENLQKSTETIEAELINLEDKEMLFSEKEALLIDLNNICTEITNKGEISISKDIFEINVQEFQDFVQKELKENFDDYDWEIELLENYLIISEENQLENIENDQIIDKIFEYNGIKNLFEEDLQSKTQEFMKTLLNNNCDENLQQNNHFKNKQFLQIYDEQFFLSQQNQYTKKNYKRKRNNYCIIDQQYNNNNLTCDLSQRQNQKLMKEGKCFHCNQIGHKVKDCQWKLNNWKSKIKKYI